MRDEETDETLGGRVARLEQQVRELLDVVAAQTATIQGYERRSGARSAVEPAMGSAEGATDADVEVAADRAIGRRRLLLGGATATAAAAAAAIAGTATPAAAANGGNLILGQNNTATAETKLSYGGSGNNGFRVEGASSLAMIEGYQTGSAPAVKGAHAGVGQGVAGLSADGTGVYGESGRLASEGIAGGVTGVSTGGGAGVSGYSDGYGIIGQGTASGVGVYAYAEGAGAGLLSDSDEGIGAVARGAKANLHLPLRSGRAAPTSDSTAHSVGEVVVDGSGAVWLCIADGTPGTWRKIGGPATAGAFHVLPAPARIVDTRPGGVPTSVVPKTPLAAGSTRVYDLKVNGSGVPAGATAALITVLLVNAANVNGNMTLWANGVAKPTANTMVWGAGSGRWTATAVSALDSQARVQVNVSAKTDLVLDVVGYYR